MPGRTRWKGHECPHCGRWCRLSDSVYCTNRQCERERIGTHTIYQCQCCLWLRLHRRMGRPRKFCESCLERFPELGKRSKSCARNAAATSVITSIPKKRKL